jgi:peptide/nickel transport system ATP-binding protein
LHPYTQLLIGSLPSLGSKDKLVGIPGLPPSLLNRPSDNCPFHPRCPYAMERCKTQQPALQELRPGHWAACHLYDDPISKPVLVQTVGQRTETAPAKGWVAR